MTTDENYEAVLADLERKRGEITTAIGTIRSLMGLAPESGNTDEDSPRNVGNGVKLRDDEFFGMSIPNAAMKLLAASKKPMTAPEVARELKAHGLINDSRNFTNSVYSALHREQGRGNVVQTTGKRWGLVGWYPKGARKAKAAHLTDSGGAPDPILPEQPDEQSPNDAAS